MSDTHVPTEKSVQRSKLLLWPKVKLATIVLKLFGKSRSARRLQYQYTAFTIQNTLGYVELACCSGSRRV